MRFRSGLTEEELSRGFDGGNDIFEKKPLAERLTSLITSMEGGSVFILDGAWGSGKSTFVKQWSSHLTRDGIANIYFDAFACDFIETPFNAVASAFVRAACDARKQDDPKFKEFLSKAAAVGRLVASSSVKIAVKAATLGVLSSDDLKQVDEISKSISDGLGEISEAGVKKILEEQADCQAAFDALGASIQDMKALLGGEGNSPLIIFVDELDRCKPDFALGIIEALKHFFRVDGVHFCLVTRKRYLQSSVDRKYGQGEFSEDYLDKFYDFIVTYDVTNDIHRGFGGYIVNVVRRYFPISSRDDADFVDALKEVCAAYRLSLRQIETLCITCCIGYMACAGLRFYRPNFLVIFLSLVKVRRFELYSKISNRSAQWEPVRDFLNQADWSSPRGQRIRNMLQLYFDGSIDLDSEYWKPYAGLMQGVYMERLEVAPMICCEVLDRFHK